MILGHKENVPYGNAPDQSHPHSQEVEYVTDMAMVDGCWLRFFSYR